MNARSSLSLLGGAATSAAGVALAVALWWAISLGMDPVRLPSPGDVLDALRAGWTSFPALEFVGFQVGGIRDAVEYTTVDVLIGVGAGCGLGLLVGVLVGSVRLARELLGPPLMVLGTVPVLVLLPFLLIWFGTARLAQSGLVIFFTFVTISAVTAQAVRNVGSTYNAFAAALGAGRWRVMRTVVLPAVLPEVLGGIRVSLAAGWSFATVSELIGGQQGAGKIIQAMAQLQRTADVLAVVLALGVVAIIFDTAVTAAGRWVVRWQE